ncbi:MAG: zinc-binding dehydrogenase, partial [Acidimicrobiia bacterium]
ADLALDPVESDIVEATREWSGGLGVDGVLELVGPATMPQTLAALAKGGRMVIVGCRYASADAQPGGREDWVVHRARVQMHNPTRNVTNRSCARWWSW